MDSEVREQRLRLLVGDRWMDNDVVTLIPINRCCNTMFVAELKRVNYSDNFILYDYA